MEIATAEFNTGSFCNLKNEEQLIKNIQNIENVKL